MLSFRLQAQLPEFALDIELGIGRETLVLVGPSGAGKSTTLSMLAGIRAPERGRIELDGAVLFDDAARINVPPERRHIGYVLQHYALFPHLRVRDNIAYGIRRLSERERTGRMRRIVKTLGIGSLLDARVTQISGGERQRVAIARALVTEPRALFLDEPLAALDVEHRSRIRLELRTILEDLETPSVVVSHSYEDARILGDRIAVVNDGRVVQAGAPDELVRHPADAFVARFCGTNFVRVAVGGVSAAAAFDPWRARVARGPADARFAWTGTVVDVAHMGAALRLHVEGEHSLFADLVSGSDAQTYRAGDVVSVSVDPADVRFIGERAPAQA